MSIETILASLINRELNSNSAQQKSGKPDENSLYPIQLLRISIIISDFSSILLCSLIAKLFYLNLFLHESSTDTKYLIVGIIGSIFGISVFGLRGHYQQENLQIKPHHITRVVRAISLVFIILLLFGYGLKIAEDYSRGWFVIWLVLCFLIVLPARAFVNYLLNATKFSNLTNQSVAIVGEGPQTKQLISDFTSNQSHQKLFAVYSTNENVTFNTSNSDVGGGNISHLIKDCLNNKFKTVIISLPKNRKLLLEKLLRQLSKLPLNIHIHIDKFETNYSVQPKISYLDGNIYLVTHKMPITFWGSILKKTIDYTVAIILLILVLPLMLVVSAWIKLDSRGPIFFIQKRHGLNHKSIRVLKFRTMTVLEDGKEITQATQNDPRITRAGRFLRRTSIDELPQLINVLRGEMSIVGPRPHAISHNEIYSQTLEHYPNRHKVKPGITGWAQIKGYRGETKNLEQMRLRAEADNYYIDNWSIWFDLLIILLTPISLITKRNAY